jgi:triosephosphate isomerase
MKKLIAGNWKMNTTQVEAKSLVQGLKDKLSGSGHQDTFQMVICPPTIWLHDVLSILGTSHMMAVGGQDCHASDKGAYTGNISAPMLKEIGCTYVIVGHSERRQFHNETNAQVKAKAQAAIKQGLIPIICVGEIEEERLSGSQEFVVGQQLAESLPESLPESGAYVVAYEPVWAIGTGKTATTEDVRTMHGFIRQVLAKMVDQPDKVAILYGGSVKASNAVEILGTVNVDGVLVGGASLQLDEFWAIAQAA